MLIISTNNLAGTNHHCPSYIDNTQPQEISDALRNTFRCTLQMLAFLVALSVLVDEAMEGCNVVAWHPVLPTESLKDSTAYLATASCKSLRHDC